MQHKTRWRADEPLDLLSSSQGENSWIWGRQIYLICLKIAQSKRCCCDAELTATACDRKSPEQESWEQKAKCSTFRAPNHGCSTAQLCFPAVLMSGLLSMLIPASQTLHIIGFHTAIPAPSPSRQLQPSRGCSHLT